MSGVIWFVSGALWFVSGAILTVIACTRWCLVELIFWIENPLSPNRPFNHMMTLTHEPQGLPQGPYQARYC